jgi:hypothetical protein
MISESTDSFCEMICAWQERVEKNITFTLYPHQVDLVRIFSEVFEFSSISSPGHFKICNWENTLDAFMKLKAHYCHMQSGEIFLEIAGRSRLRLYVNEYGAGCERTDRVPDLILDELSATRYIFGPYPPIYTSTAPTIAQSWFPLPMSWNGQDRI